VFLDEVQLVVSSGRGGDGAVHFRREKYVPRGGPDGGRGGRGGDVIFRSRPDRSTLAAFQRKRVYLAADGRPGGPSRSSGRSGENLVLDVPVGTVIRDVDTGDVVADLLEPGQQVVVCRGGRGGRGNSSFATAQNQAPRMAERGAPGRRRELHLELRLIADVGIVGVPNAGKSTLLAALTRARPKIADYPFTTLQPHLGVVEFEDASRLILADIPGLIEGAHAGAGLGDAFLRHVQRTRLLIHLLDGLSGDPLADYSQIQSELALFDDSLADKPQIVTINKIDLQAVRDRRGEVEARMRALGLAPIWISAEQGTGIGDLMKAVRKAAAQAPPPVKTEAIPIYRWTRRLDEFDIVPQGDRTWRVEGEPLERAAAMTYWDNEEAIRRFQRLLARIGVDEALRRAGARTGDTVNIGEYELEWVD
jgi:GTP-binding protein